MLEGARPPVAMRTSPNKSMQTADLINTFMMAMEVQHEARDIVRCWGEPPDSCPVWPQVQEFAQVTALLDSMAAWVPRSELLMNSSTHHMNRATAIPVAMWLGVSLIWKSSCPQPKW